ncbi:MAG: hypothetical protein Q8K70_06960 [Bacteroidota bacterium]|nr:hypothetical protein [Bacteroidota bacterium]
MIKLLKFITEAIGWLQIATSPMLIGIFFGALVYYSNPSKTNLIIGISVAILGLIFGMLWAIRISKTNGSIEFMSKIIATPELDKKVNDKN